VISPTEVWIAMALAPCSTELTRRALEIAFAALEQSDATRYAWALAECGEDADLRAEVDALLAADREEEPRIDSGEAAELLFDPRVGTQVGRFRLEERIGSGGMGNVYRGVSEDGIAQQAVALKLLKRGMDSEDIVRRFVRERDILARLEHPNIARLLDGGMTDDGSPWFALELIQGEPLHSHCDAQRLSVAARIDLFLQVCDAVEYAHRNLVIHRDLKPSNVFVNQQGQVKLLDFGIAKLIDSDSAFATRTQAVVMTPEYSAPEQFEHGRVTTLTDVYQLGLLLSELLSGQRPEPLRSTATDSRVTGHLYASFVVRYAEHDPLLRQRAAARASSVSALARALRGDLDRIVRKATQPEPERRYSSALALADDLRRYRQGLPVLAMGDSLTYRLGKLLQRHRWMTAATLLLFTGVLSVVAGVYWQGRETAAERDSARLEAQRYQSVLDYLRVHFRERDYAIQHEGSKPAEADSSQELADIEASFATDPASALRVLATLGEMHVQLNDYAGAMPLLQSFLAHDDGTAPRPLRAQVMADMATAELRQGDHASACPRIAEAITLLRQSTADQRNRLGDALSVHGQCLRRQGQAEASLAAYREAVVVDTAVNGARSRQTANAISNLSVALQSLGRREEAREQAETALTLYRELELMHLSSAATTLGNLAALNFQDGELTAAQSNFAEAVASMEANEGESAALAALLNNQGKLLILRGELEAADQALHRAQAMQVRYVGAESPDVAFTLLSRAELALARDQAAEARGLAEQAGAQLSRQFGERHPLTLRATLMRALATSAEGQGEAADVVFAELRDALREADDPASTAVRGQLACAELGHRLQWQQVIDEADVVACDHYRAGFADTHFESISTTALLALAQHRRADAAQAIDRLQRELGDASPRLRRLRALARS